MSEEEQAEGTGAFIRNLIIAKVALIVVVGLLVFWLI